MNPTVSVSEAISNGLNNLKVNFWPFMLIIIILGILDSIGNGPAFRDNVVGAGEQVGGQWNKGALAFFIGVFIKPVFDYGSKLIMVRTNRGESLNMRDIVEGFDSRELYIDIILTNIMVVVMVIIGFICLVLPGIYVGCRIFLAPYLVIDKGLAPRQAIGASWELTRDFWPNVLGLGIIAFLMMIGGLVLLIVGMIPAFAWIKAMFAAFYQQVLDVHSEEFLLSLDIEP